MGIDNNLNFLNINKSLEVKGIYFGNSDCTDVFDSG